MSGKGQKPRRQRPAPLTKDRLNRVQLWIKLSGRYIESMNIGGVGVGGCGGGLLKEEEGGV